MQNSFLNSYSRDHFEIQCTLSFKKHHLAQWWCSVLDVEHTWSVHGNGMVMYIAQQIDSELYQCGQLNPKPDIWARKNCREAKYPSSVGKLPFAVIGTWPWNRAWCLEENNSVFTNVFMMTIICQRHSSQWIGISLWYSHEIGILHFLWIQSFNSSSSLSELNNCIDSDGLDVYSIDVGLNSLCSHTEAAFTVILWIFTTCGTLYVLAIPQTFADARWLNPSSNLHEAAVIAMVPWHSTHDNLVVCSTV